MSDIKLKLLTKFISLLSGDKLKKPEKLILNLLVENWGTNLSQKDIIKNSVWREIYPSHVRYINEKKYETALREARRIIRNLKVNHQIPIISSFYGYCLPSTYEELDDYIKRLEKESRQRAVSSLETYRSLKGLTGITSPYFEDYQTIGGQLMEVKRF